MLPVIVRLQRTGKKVIQDCDVYIGHEWEKGGWKLAKSKWYNPFRVGALHNSHDIMQRYEDSIRQSPLWDELGELSGKVLGCWCKMPNEFHKTCHGDVLIKLWKERFGDYKEDPYLWRKHYYPEGKPEISKKRKTYGEKKTPAKKRQKLFRTQDTHPDGLPLSGKKHPWPLIDHPDNHATIWIDEAGMGCWAGPLHVGGTVILPGFDIKGVHDSKLLKEHERLALYEQLIKSDKLIWHVESVPNTKVDELKLGQAWRWAIRETIRKLCERVSKEHPEIKLTQVVLDGNKLVNNTVLPVTPEPKADRLYVGVAAAAILAKVSRDQYMAQVAPQYPEFHELFLKGKGYRHSAKHDELIKAGKYTELHRKSYNPLRTLLEKEVVKTKHVVLTMSGIKEI